MSEGRAVLGGDRPIASEEVEVRPVESTVIDLYRAVAGAAEGYRQALRWAEDAETSSALWRIHSEHLYAMQALRTRLARGRTEPVERGGTRNGIPPAANGPGGEPTARGALAEAEERLVLCCRSVLSDASVDRDLKFVVENDLLPACYGHLGTLKELDHGAR